MRKLRAGIFLKTLGLFVLLGGVCGTVWIVDVVYFYRVSDRASRTHSLADQIEIQMLQARRNEKDFQLRDLQTPGFYQDGKGVNLDLHIKSIARMQQAINDLDALHTLHVDQQIADLREKTKGYDNSFNALVTAYRDRGLGTFGSVGAMEAAISNLQGAIGAARSPAMMLTLLKTAASEHEYLFDGDQTDAAGVKDGISALRAQVSTLSGAARSEISSDLDALDSAFQRYLQSEKLIGKTEADGLQGEMRTAIHNVEPLVSSIVAQADKLSQTSEAFALVMRSIIIIMAITMLVGCTLFALLARSMSRPIQKAIDVLSRMAKGDLTSTLDARLLKRRDEVGDFASALHDMSGQMRGMVSTIKESAEQVAASSQQIAASTQSLSEGAQTTASSLEETSASMEELAASVSQVAEHAQSQTSAVEKGTGSMAECQKSIDEISRSLTEIAGLADQSVEKSVEGARAVSQVAEGIGLIAESSSRIGSIVTVISDIADQTNLLALNASIEAARAGEHGRGFAVVAEEVGKLAERSALSTKEIEGIIRESEKNVHQGVETAHGSQQAMDQIREASQKVKNMIAELSNAMTHQLMAARRLVDALESVNGMSQSISAATQEQTASARQVSLSVENANELTQSAASSAEQISASTHQLSVMAEQLQRTTAQFRLSGNGNGNGRHPTLEVAAK